MAGFTSVLAWTEQAISDELHRISVKLCANVDSVVRQLRAKGAVLPNGFDSWSCDQKLVFLSAIGPLMIQAILAGALVGGLATGAAQYVKAGFASASKALTDYAKQLGISVPSIGVGGTAGDIIHHVLGGLTVEWRKKK